MTQEPTHDWSRAVDVDHLQSIRAASERYARGGAFHLLLEVLAYAAEEAAATSARAAESAEQTGPAGPAEEARPSGAAGAGEPGAAGPAVCRVTLYADGSVSVADSGRGTQTRLDDGPPRRKPVTGTPDLRLFDRDPPELLPDGLPRRGLSVVAALSPSLVHLNRRTNGAWQQRSAFGVPVTDLVAVEPDGTTGTTVTFTPDGGLAPLPPADAAAWRLLDAWPHLTVLLDDLRRPHQI